MEETQAPSSRRGRECSWLSQPLRDQPLRGKLLRATAPRPGLRTEAGAGSGCYGASAAPHVNWLVTVGHDGTWVAFAAWAALFAAMLAFLAGFPRCHPAPGNRAT